MFYQNVSARIWILLAITALIFSWHRLDPAVGPVDESRTALPPGPAAILPEDFKPLSPHDETRPDGLEYSYDLPFSRADQQRLAGIELHIAMPTSSGGLAQTLVEADHRHSFAHEIRLPAGNSAVHRVGFENKARATWQALDHAGRWTHLEIKNARRLQLKIFPEQPIPGPPVVSYRPIYFAGEQLAEPSWVDVLESEFKLGGRFELAFSLAYFPGNIFAPQEQGLACLITTPEGGEVEVVPFIFQDFQAVTSPTGEVILPLGGKHWRARFRPRQPGLHHYKLVMEEDGQPRNLATGSFTVTPGKPPAFIQISPQAPRYFTDSNGHFFYPIGWNLVYPVDIPYDIEYVDYLPRENSLSMMLRMIDDLADSGGNFFRFWMTEWFAGIEWHREVDDYGGIGVYNLKNAWIIDQILEHSRSRGVYVLFETLNHVRLANHHSWPDHPYARANGGFLANPRAFWTHSRVIAEDGRRLRYILARFADSPAIQSWNYMSEPDLVSQRIWSRARTLILHQLAWMREHDPYRRLTSNHLNTHSRDFSFFAAPEIDFIHSNAYPGIHGLAADQVFAVRQFSEVFADQAKPVMISEFGGHWAADPAQKMSRDIIGGLWAGICSDLSGTALNWWWNFTYGEDLGRKYRIAAAFLEGENLIDEDTGEKGYWRNRPVRQTSRDDNLRGLMVGNQKRRWVYLFNYDTVCRSRPHPTYCKDNKVVFNELEDGFYEAAYWDPETGQLVGWETVRVEQGEGLLSPPAFTHGLVAKLNPVDQNRPPPANLTDDAPPPFTTAKSAVTTELERQPAKWHSPAWRIVPLLPVTMPERVVYQVEIALPDELAGSFPWVLGPDHRKVPFFWQFLAAETGWRITIPGDQEGPFMIRPSPVRQIPANPFDKEDAGMSLTISSGREPPIMDKRKFTEIFAARTNQQKIRVGEIDLLENPFGDNNHFLTKFEGPLMIPESGLYSFSINSDDGSFLKLNGEPVVEWLGNHTPEGENKPLYNAWRRRRQIHLEPGFHHLEYYHQEYTGWQMARVGWRRPTFSEPLTGEIMDPALTSKPPDWELIPPAYLDGVVPVKVELLADREPVATVLPAVGLRLRRPARDIAVGRWRKTGEKQITTGYFKRPGRQLLETAAGDYPVWVDNRVWQPFSIEWEEARDDQGNRFIAVLLYDNALPITLRTSDSPQTRQLRPNEPAMFSMPAEDLGKSFTLSLGTVELLDGQTEPPPQAARPPERRLRNPRFDRLVGPARDGNQPPLPLSALKPWYRGRTEPGQTTVAVTRHSFDPWQSSPADLIARLELDNGTTGVILMLDNRPELLNLRVHELERRLSDWTGELVRAGIVPLLVIDGDIDIADPLTFNQAMVLVSMRDQYNLPLVDLRLAK